MIGLTAVERARRVARPVRRGYEGFARLGEHITFFVHMVAGVPFAVRKYWRHILREIGDVSFGSASLLAGGGTIGIVFAMSGVAAITVGVETHRGLELLGMTSLSGLLTAIANTRKLAPVVASIALAAKVGTGFTARLGAMRISDEIDALDSMAVRSIPFLASTRLVAAVVCVVPIYMVGLLASYIATRFTVVNVNGDSAGTYDYYFHLGLGASDLWLSLAKVLVFAVIVALVHCSYGFHASGGPEGVGRAAGRALRTSILTIGIADVVLTFALWGIEPSVPGLGIS